MREHKPRQSWANRVENNAGHVPKAWEKGKGSAGGNHKMDSANIVSVQTGEIIDAVSRSPSRWPLRPVGFA